VQQCAESLNSLLPPFGERTWTAGPTPATVNVAVTAFTASIVTTQLPVPVHAPVQPVNVDPEAGVAVSVTTVL
jgi:hypothetical protein